MTFKGWLVIVKSKLLKLWTKLSEEQREKVIETLEFVINAVLSAFLLTIPFYIFLTFFYSLYIHHFLAIWTIFSIIIPFLEHYYIWLREGWKRAN